jgi:twitching motility protein PilT
LALKNEIRSLLKYVVECDASDLHVAVGEVPTLRINGTLKRLTGNKLGPKDVQRMLLPLLTERMTEEFNKNLEFDFSFSLDKNTRFRVNYFMAEGAMGAAFRVIPANIPTFEDISFPNIGPTLAETHNGMILVTGPTGSGKSTTLAAIINEINRTRRCRIFTIEDPVEFVHKNQKAFISQRELNSDTLSYAGALKHLLRQDPDVVLLGEMRDYESIALAITIAETGHLVLSTLHTLGASETIHRIIDVFPSDQQNQIRIQLANVLRAVISQQLILRPDGKGRLAAREIMVVTSGIRNMIRDGKTYHLTNAIDTGKSMGMQSMEEDIANLYKAGKINLQDGISRVPRVDHFLKLTGAEV